MSWAKLDDQFFTHPKVIDLPKDAKLLFLAALTYCAGQLTNGIVTPGALRVIAATVDVSRDEAATLVASGLWEKSEAGWQVHDYLEYQPTRDKALATKQARAEAGSVGGHKSADSRAQAKQEANTEANAQAKQEAKSNPVPVPVPIPNPDPIQEPPTAARATRVKPACSVHPAVCLFQDGFQSVKGRIPAKNKPMEDRAIALFEAQGEETYRRGLDGFFSCLDGADPYPKTKGFDFAVFVRQFDTWEGGSAPPASRPRSFPAASIDLSPEARRARIFAAIP